MALTLGSTQRGESMTGKSSDLAVKSATGRLQSSHLAAPGAPSAPQVFVHLYDAGMVTTQEDRREETWEEPNPVTDTRGFSVNVSSAPSPPTEVWK